MRALKSIKTEKIVSIDIETVRLYDRLSEAPEGLRTAWAYKQKVNGVQKSKEELELLWVQQASLYAEFSKVCSCSLAFLDTEGKTLMCQNFTSEDELSILENISSILNRISTSSRDYRLLAHSGIFFDYPYLGKRFIINDLDIPMLLDHSGLKPWEVTNMDSNDLWRLGGTGAGSSLMALTEVLNIPTPKDEMTGSDVGSYYFNGDYKAIGDYCDKDAIATFNVIRKFKKESIFQFEDVVHINSNVESNNEEIPPLQRLINTGVFDEKIQTDIKKLIEDNNATDEEIKNIRDIVLAHYQGIKENVANKKAKEEEVDNFFNSLK